MAVTSDNAVTNGRGRPTGNSIVIAGDRTVTRRTARRHSGRVRALKFFLPVIALATLAVCADMVLKGTDFSSAIPDIQMPQIVAENLKMYNPHYEGFNTDGGRYWVKAETAQQDLKSLTVMRLEGITGELTDVKKQKTKLVAKRGVYDTKSGLLELFDSIDVQGDGGMTATLTRASIKTKEGIVISDQPSKVVMQAGQITSNQMTIRQKAKEYTFVDDVRVHMKPKAPEPSTDTDQTPTTPPLPFGKPGEPIDITASRLDIDDAKKSALFSGQVVATQAGSTMTAPELDVTYEGAIAPQDPKSTPSDAGAADGATKVKQIVAKDQVTLHQPTGETATSTSAIFDADAQTAVLEGDVMLTEGEDKRAVGDRAEYDQAAQTMVLTGPVVVTQGPNVLKGRRLVYARTTSKMRLTSPDGPAPGRISAHFIRTAAKAPPPNSDNDQAGENKSSDGISFGGTFKTDPKAPFDLTADRLDVDDTAKTAVFTGDVVANQGESTISAGELTAFYKGSANLAASADGTAAPAAALTRIRARKKVSIGSKDGQNATGDWAEIDVKKNIATLGGDVVLTQGKNIVKGTKAEIDMNTGQATIKAEPSAPDGGAMISSSDGDGSGQINKADRPSAVFYPSELSELRKTKKENVDGWQARTSP